MRNEQSMNAYLHSLKTIVDGLTSIQSLVYGLKLIQLTTTGLAKGYDSFVTTFSMLPGATSFDDLHSKLLFYEQCLSLKKDRPTYVHQAFVATTGTIFTIGNASRTNQNSTT